MTPGADRSYPGALQNTLLRLNPSVALPVGTDAAVSHPLSGLRGPRPLEVTCLPFVPSHSCLQQAGAPTAAALTAPSLPICRGLFCSRAL